MGRAGHRVLGHVFSGALTAGLLRLCKAWDTHDQSNRTLISVKGQCELTNSGKSELLFCGQWWAGWCFCWSSWEWLEQSVFWRIVLWRIVLWCVTLETFCGDVFDVNVVNFMWLIWLAACQPDLHTIIWNEYIHMVKRTHMHEQNMMFSHTPQALQGSSAFQLSQVGLFGYR